MKLQKTFNINLKTSWKAKDSKKNEFLLIKSHGCVHFFQKTIIFLKILLIFRHVYVILNYSVI